jgi:hypothetical protein
VLHKRTRISTFSTISIKEIVYIHEDYDRIQKKVGQVREI